MLLILFFLSAPNQAAIFGDGNPDNGIEDQRQKAPENLLSALGTIFCDGGLRGTATHITTLSNHGPSIILTAAHVLFDKNTGRPFKTCRYRPQNRRLSSVGFAAVADHQYSPFSKDKIRQSETDIVFVALQKSTYQPSLKLAPATNISGTGLQLLGYNEERQKIQLSSNCESYHSKMFVSELLLLHNCDALSGASGGPIVRVIDSENNSAVVAVHGGTLYSADSAPAGAKANPEKWINQARKVDSALLNRLEQFLAYLAKDFPSRK